MFKMITEEIEWCGKKLTFETGRMARQANGAVLVTYGETQILATAVAAAKARESCDFMPLTVNYQEKTFAAGKIPGGFFKREGRPSEKETLTSRLIDRPLRPLFPEGFYHETQIICTVLSYDTENDPDIVALIGASAALAISGIPIEAPIGAVRAAFINDKIVLNPLVDDMEESELDLIVAGTKEGVMMVESEACELSEEQMLDALKQGHKAIIEVINCIEKFAKKAAKPRWSNPEKSPDAEKLLKEIEKKYASKLLKAYGITAKQERVQALDIVRNEVLEAYQETPEKLDLVSQLLKKIEKNIVRQDILENSKRIDGRKLDDVRQIDCQIGILKRTHGSALFTRGETQALAAVTLGTPQDQQIVDALEGEYREPFMLHYNFPPYSVGEASFLRSPGRREIGHGKLAWRAMHSLIPSDQDFPYTMRIVSEVTESNGSSSMATVCASSLAMMDAGIPIESACAGIAMGLIKEGKKFAILSDILGDEDHLGDMDFKVAGTRQGITALQMDIKIPSITHDIMKKALEQAKAGRFHILDEMKKSLDTARPDISPYAPAMRSLSIPKDKIRDVIGTGGKVIRGLCEETNSKIDINDDGTINISASDTAAIDEAEKRIMEIVSEPEINLIYQGKVVKITEFGAFVNFMGNRDGLVHISQLAEGHTKTVNDVVSEGDQVYVKCLSMDDRGKVRLSMREVDQGTGVDISDQIPAGPEHKPRPRSSPSRPRRRDR